MHSVGTITINVSDNVEQSFRKKAYQLYGKKKGTLGKAVTEAIQEWSKKQEHFDRCMELLKSGIDMGKLKYKNRQELHGRN